MNLQFSLFWATFFVLWIVQSFPYLLSTKILVQVINAEPASHICENIFYVDIIYFLILWCFEECLLFNMHETNFIMVIRFCRFEV